MVDTMRTRQHTTTEFAQSCRTPYGSFAHRSGFSILDLLVSIAVIGVLLGILTPTLSLVTEAARRVKCQKKLSDNGLALTMYADDHRDTLPPSNVAEDIYSVEASSNAEIIQSSALMQLAHRGANDPNNFDGLGRLVDEEYLSGASTLYCPSHAGDHPHEDYESSWVELGSEIVINYHYRLLSDTDKLAMLDPNTTLITDGMRSVADYNHRSGNNMLKADMSVVWYSDESEYITSMLPQSETAPGAGIPVSASWTVLDTGTPPETTPVTPQAPNTNALIWD